MTFWFHRPVFTGDRVECLCTATVVEDRGDRMYIEFDVRCSNQDGKDVLTGGTKGAIIRREAASDSVWRRWLYTSRRCSL